MTFLKKVWLFISKSSADPKATSLTVKFALLGIIPYIMQALSLVCAVGQQCYSVDATLLEVAFEAIADGVFYVLMLVSVAGSLYGAARKIVRTFKGENLVIE